MQAHEGMEILNFECRLPWNVRAWHCPCVFSPARMCASVQIDASCGPQPACCPIALSSVVALPLSLIFVAALRLPHVQRVLASAATSAGCTAFIAAHRWHAAQWPCWHGPPYQLICMQCSNLQVGFRACTHNNAGRKRNAKCSAEGDLLRGGRGLEVRSLDRKVVCLIVIPRFPQQLATWAACCNTQQACVRKNAASKECTQAERPRADQPHDTCMLPLHLHVWFR